MTSKLWMMKAVYSKNLHLKTKEVCDRYGELKNPKPEFLGGVSSEPVFLGAR